MKRIASLAIVICLSGGFALAQQKTDTPKAIPSGSQKQPTRRPGPPQIGELSAKPGVHDPVMAKEGNTYYVFYTGSGTWSSTDMLTWKRGKPVFDASNTPAWIKGAGFNRPGYWAPDIEFFNGQWYLYYSISAFGKNTSAIGVATNKTLDPASADYKWVDQGKVVQTYPGKTNWNAIDPNLVVDIKTGSPWLVYGSFWRGIQLVKLQKDGLRLANPIDSLTEHTIASRIADYVAPQQSSTGAAPAIAGANAIEGPFIFVKGKYYYLFVSFDYCCRGAKSNYKIAVGRATKVTGPYLDKNGRDMAKGGGYVLREGDGKEFYGLGHCATYTIGNTDYLIYHAYTVADNGSSKLVIEKLTWDKAGWPLIAERVMPAIK